MPDQNPYQSPETTPKARRSIFWWVVIAAVAYIGIGLLGVVGTAFFRVLGH